MPIDKNLYKKLPSINITIDASTAWQVDYNYYTRMIGKYKNNIRYELLLREGDRWCLGTYSLQLINMVLDYGEHKLGIVYGYPSNKDTLLIIALSLVASLLLVALILGVIYIESN